MVIRERTYTADEFFEIARLPENENRRLELVNGSIIEIAASRPVNTVIAIRLATFLNNHILPDNPGYVTGADGGFRLDEGHVRQPDVAFVSGARYDSLPDFSIPVSAIFPA